MTVLHNHTLMEARLDLLDSRSGHEVLTVTAKMTWAVGPSGEVSHPIAPSPVRLDDEWWGAPHASTLKYPCDLAPEKPGTDVILVGTARPPREGAREIDVGIMIEREAGPLQKIARVHGPRTFEPGVLGVMVSAPGPLAPTPLIYELAYGGADPGDPQRAAGEPDNPIGVGFARQRRALAGSAAPAIEDLAAPFLSRAPAVAGFAAIPPEWRSRSRFAGTHDEAWRAERAPLPPVDLDPRFYSVAAPGLWSEIPLGGDEPVSVIGVREEGLWRFRLPLYPPLFRFIVRGAARAAPTHLDTLLVDADGGRVELTFRASMPVPRKVQAIEAVEIEPGAPLPEHLRERAATRDDEEEDDGEEEQA